MVKTGDIVHSQVLAEAWASALAVPGTEVLPRRGMPLKMIAPKATLRDQHSDIPGARGRLRTVADLWRLAV